MIQYYLYRFGQFCVCLLPVQLAYKIASAISDLHYYFSARDRRAVKNNLRVIFPDQKNYTHSSREVFRNFGKYLVDFFRMPGLVDEKYIQNKIDIQNLRYLDDAIKKECGVILLTAHVGNWELGGFVLSKLGYPMIAVALPHKQRTVNNLFNSQRQSEGMTVVPNNVAIRECIKGLGENKIVALLGDRVFNGHGVTVDFFGKKTIIPKGPAAFALKTGASIVPSFLIRESDDRYVLCFETPIVPNLLNVDKNQELLRILNECTMVIQEKIRQCPEQWFMFRKFWVS